MPVLEADGLHIVCDDPIEVARAQTLLTKEPGTIAWLRAQIRPGDIVWDIGANIGLYTLVAARLVGPLGRVYAFEPHLVNAMQLLRTLQVNLDLQPRVRVIPVALDRVDGVRPFYYASLRAGSSGSQLEEARGEAGRFTPAAIAWQAVVSGDGLLWDKDIRSPQIIKIDVDGRELSVLEGMYHCLTQATPRSLQVETRAADRTAIVGYLAECGYHVERRHFTANGAAAHAKGVPADQITDNTIFARDEVPA
jgi:FkbM family methyltransferase